MRLIDADGLSKSIYDNVSAPYEDAVAAKEDCLRAIEEAPTIDAVPVVHGRWVNFYGDFSIAECSECESQFEVTFDDESNGALWDGFRQFYNYCPTCGAKMDRKGEEA